MANPFYTAEAALQAGNRFGAQNREYIQKQRDQQEQSAIGNILRKYGNPQDPMGYNETINLIMSSVRNPELRQGALDALTSQEKTNQEKLALQRKRTDYQNAGINPALAGVDPSLAKAIYQQQQLSNILNPSSEFTKTDNTYQPMETRTYDSFKGEANALQSQLVPDEKIAEVNAINPQLGAQLQKRNENIQNRLQRIEDNQYKKFIDERNFHTKVSEKQVEEVDNLVDVLRKQEGALELAKDSYENEDVTFFSKDNLANVTGLGFFRTARGAALNQAVKENLLNNLSRVSARAQNLWMEKRMSSMVPRVGENLEANQTVATAIEGENLLDRAYINTFRRLQQEDIDKYGYERRDLKRRAQNELERVDREILDRTSYRMKVIEENEKLNKNGKSALQKEVGKPVFKGTPLTPAMGKLYQNKYGENYKKKAMKDGYKIPTYEEVKKYLMDYHEYRGTL